LHKLISDEGFVGNFHSIDGREVCEFLDIYPQIRRSFPQLIGLADLDKIINKDLYERSMAFVSDIQPKLATFLATGQYFTALGVLSKNHFAVLDGPPETGKTFIGAALSLAYASDGFEIYDIKEPNDIFKIFDATTKQVFFADDAIGSITFEPSLGNDWSRQLVSILNKLDKKHKLIWTARRYILQEAMERTKLTELIDNFPGIHEVLVSVGDLTLMEKALILYNHVKHAKVSPAARNIIKDKASFISNHPNYTPERIRQLACFLLPQIEGNYTKPLSITWSLQIDNFLKDPSDRFRRVYNEAIGHSEKMMLMTLLDLGKKVSREELEREYERRISTI